MSEIRQELSMLEREFGRMSDEERLSALASVINRLSLSDNQENVTLEAHPYNPSNMNFTQTVDQFVMKHGIDQSRLFTKLTVPERQMKYGSTFPPPLLRIPCANHNVHKHTICANEGTRPCGACRLVKYCSKECQVGHWKIHKRDCQNALRSEKWLPHWCQERREPSFSQSPVRTFYGRGMALYGNMPAIDIINLANNEGLSWKKDMTIAFIASGDLRNVIRTVTTLPAEFNHKLSIVINDRTPLTVCRTFLILSILSLIDNEEAVEYGLHLWYSAFLPEAFLHRVLSKLAPVIKKLSSGDAISLSDNASVRAHWRPNSFAFFAATMASFQMDMSDAHNEFMSTMVSPHRIDYRDKFQYIKSPSHRMAYKEFWNFGILLPFGTPNYHFNMPNRWMYTLQGNLALEDFDSPLKGWDTKEAVAEGAKHGATQEDIFGCMFFYIKEQLTMFSRRLRKHKIQFHLFDQDARDLPIELRRLSMTSFDRIEVSNITDHTYLGTEAVLRDWSPFLSKQNKHAAILGLYMNWTGKVPEGRAMNCKDDVGKFAKMYADRFPQFEQKIMAAIGVPFPPIIYTSAALMDAFQNKSRSFEKYMALEKEGEVSKSCGLTRRTINGIVPHRLHARLGTSSSSLPDLQDDESWYHAVCLGDNTLTERYVEWTRTQ